MPGKKKTMPVGHYYDYASEQMKNVEIKGMSPDMARKALDNAYYKGKADYITSTKFDGLKNISSMPQQGSAFKAMGQGLNFTSKSSEIQYDSKGKKQKGLYDYK